MGRMITAVYAVDIRRACLPVILAGAMFFQSAPAAAGDLQGAASETATAACGIESMPALPDVRYESVERQSLPVTHCKVAGVIGTETHFELLLPDGWNGKFVFGGGGGFVGTVINKALGYGALQKGYATVGTDTGHRGSAIDASWALNNLERVVSFGHQAVHRTAVTAKAVIADHYGRDSSRNLFFGCSRGGGQALMEAQRYPDDFDGIVAGAPAYNWTGELGGRNTWINQAMYPNPEDLGVAAISPEVLEFIGNAVMQQCDAADGLSDGVLNDPLACDFDVSELGCEAAGASSNSCLSAAELQAAQRAYGGFVLNGEQLVPGYPPGAERQTPAIRGTPAASVVLGPTERQRQSNNCLSRSVS